MAISPQDYLQQELTQTGQYLLTTEDRKALKFEGVEPFVFRRLRSKKFRKTRLDPESEAQVKKAISINIGKNSPIQFVYPFGGYKIWRVSTYPGVDWAEFMAVAHVVGYVAPIAAAYAPGAEVTFVSDDKIIEVIDNYPRESLDRYLNSFRTLLGEFVRYLPANLKINLVRVADLYSPEEYEKEGQETNDEFKRRGMSPERIAKVRKGFDFNFLWKGTHDYSKLAAPEREKMLSELVYWSESYLARPKRTAFVRGEEKIVLFSNPLPKAIDIGSTKVSKAKFWAGMGVLEQAGGRYFDRILSPKQWDGHKNEAKEAAVDLIPLTNFKRIPVFPGRLDFLRTE